MTRSNLRECIIEDWKIRDIIYRVLWALACLDLSLLLFIERIESPYERTELEWCSFCEGDVFFEIRLHHLRENFF